MNTSGPRQRGDGRSLVKVKGEGEEKGKVIDVDGGSEMQVKQERK